MTKKKKRKVFENRLKAYSAAVAGTLLLAPNAANAAIQYSGPQSLPVDWGTPQFINLDGDATVDFNFYGFTFIGGVYGSGVGIFPATGGRSFIYSSPNIFVPARNIVTSYSINSGANWTNTFIGPLAYQVYTTAGTSSYQSGNFNGTRGCIGVRFDVGVAAPDYRYGWISFRGDSPYSGRIRGWAYEDTGAPILAGAGGPPGICAPAVPAPTLNQWGMIILIALLAGAGTLMLRKQEENS